MNFYFLITYGVSKKKKHCFISRSQFSIRHFEFGEFEEFYLGFEWCKKPQRTSFKKKVLVWIQHRLGFFAEKKNTNKNNRKFWKTL